jgi:hypothetical protein
MLAAPNKIKPTEGRPPAAMNKHEFVEMPLGFLDSLRLSLPLALM